MGLKHWMVLVLAGLLAACGSGPSSRASGEAIVGKYRVQWDAVPSLRSRVPSGLTPLAFRFTYADPADGGGLTEKQWAEMAARMGLSVEVTKRVIGPDSYIDSKGNLQKCTILDIRKGICGTKMDLSLPQRVKIAQQMLARDPNCDWVGFDRGYHAATANLLGAQEYSLHVAARCS